MDSRIINRLSYDTRDGTGAAASFRRITDMVVAPSGDLYITDNIQVRKVTPAGVVTTVAGLNTFNLGQDAPGTARFGTLTSITLDATGLVVLEENTNILRHVGFDGAVSPMSATPSLRGYVDGPGSQARLSALNSLVADADGNLYMADDVNSVLRKVTPDGNVSRFGGASDGFGVTNGVLESATFRDPYPLAAARTGVMWVAQPYSLRKIQDGSVTTVLPSISLQDMTADADGNAVIVELSNTEDLTRVVQVTPAGQTSVLVTKTHVKALLKNPAAGFEPEGMATDAAGNLYIADRATSLIFKRTKSGELSVFAGTPLKDTGNVDGPVGTATLGFYGYSFLTVDDKGNLYASGHGKLRMISPAGVVSTPNLDWGDVAVGADRVCERQAVRPDALRRPADLAALISS
jgi:sugar lactone lactonase YvrE